MPISLFGHVFVAKSAILEGFEAPQTLKIEPPLQREHDF